MCQNCQGTGVAIIQTFYDSDKFPTGQYDEYGKCTECRGTGVQGLINAVPPHPKLVRVILISLLSTTALITLTIDVWSALAFIMASFVLFGIISENLSNTRRGLDQRVEHKYQSIIKNGEQLVIDHATGLIWQQKGSDKMSFERAQESILELNRSTFAGYTNWRLPTVEECIGLRESKIQENGFISSLFDIKYDPIWTADENWVIDFTSGYCFHQRVRSYAFVRAVCSTMDNEDK